MRLRRLVPVWCCLILFSLLGWASGSASGAPAESGGQAQIFVQLGHSGWITAFAFSADGRQALSGSRDKTVKLWDVASGRELRTFSSPASIGAVHFEAGGAIAAALSNGQVMLWDAGSGAVLRMSEPLPDMGQTSFPMTFSSNGRFASFGVGKRIYIVPVDGGPTLQVGEEASNSNTRFLVFSPDDRLLASGGSNGTVTLYDVASRSAIRTLVSYSGLLPRGGTATIYSVAFSSDGHTLAAVSVNNIKLWDVRNGTELQTLTGLAEVSTLAFSSDGKTLASGGEDKTVRLWDCGSGALLQSIKRENSISLVGFSKEGRLLAIVTRVPLAASSADYAIDLVDSTSGALLRKLSGRGAQLTTIAIAADGHTVAAGSASGAIGLWDVQQGRQVHKVGHSQRINALAFSADSRLLASSAIVDGAIKLWDVASGRLLRNLGDTSIEAGLDGYPGAINFSPDGRYLASGGGRSRTVTLWDVGTGNQAKVLDLGTSMGGYRFNSIGFTSIAYSPDGEQLAAADNWAGLVLANPESGESKVLLPFQASPVPTSSKLAFSPDGELVASTAYNTTWLFNRHGGDPRQLVSEGEVTALAFSPDGRQLLICTDGGSARLWDVATLAAGATGAAGVTLARAGGSITGLGFSKDGGTLYTVSRNGAIGLWSPSGIERARIIFFDDDSSLTITPEGYYDYQGDGAEDNINVRVGDQIIGIGALREKFYRPDLVRMALAGQALPGELPTLSGVKPAPEVHLDGVPARIAGETLDLRVGLADRGGGIGEVRVYVNGSAVSQVSGRDLGVAATGASRTIPLRLVPGSNEIKVVAFNAAGSLQSGAALATVVADYTPTGKPQLHALVVGIDQFDNPRLQLRYSVADATAIAEILRNKAGKLFDKVDVELLTTPQATTRDALLAAFDRYRTIAPGDVFVFYVASHGTVQGDTVASQAYYLIPSNVGLTNDEALKRDALSQDDLKRAIANIPATKKVLLLDTCQSGALGDALVLSTRGLGDEAAVKVLSSAMGSTVLAAATSQEQAIEGQEGHGVFTWVLLQGLAGQADVRHKGYVSTFDLAAYVGDEVPRIAEQVFKQKQYPNLHNAGQAFPLVSTGE